MGGSRVIRNDRIRKNINNNDINDNSAIHNDCLVHGWSTNTGPRTASRRSDTNGYVRDGRTAYKQSLLENSGSKGRKRKKNDRKRFPRGPHASFCMTALKVCSRECVCSLAHRAHHCFYIPQHNKTKHNHPSTEDGMVLYLKAAEDGKSVGDCPFAHYIRLILEEKGLPYKVEACSGPDDKPNWLLEFYEGKIPCLRHKKEAYVESNVIAAYLDYFFPSQPKPSKETKATLDDAEEVLTGFFPAVAGYLKDVEGDDDDAAESLTNLREKLKDLEDHLAGGATEGGYLDLLGDENSFGVLDCRLVPQLYHLTVGIEKFKNGRPVLETEFPKIHGYLQRSVERQSFQNTLYSPETIEWGWTNERQ
jgi:glutathione S-transferase